MAGMKKAKGWQAKEQQRKQKTAKNNSKKQQKKRWDIGKEESGVQIKPCEEEGKKGLEEYTNDLTEENHSQDSASSSTTQQSMPSLQKKTRVSPCEGQPPLEEEDCKAKGKELEKETNHLKAKCKAPEEKDSASSSTQQSTPSLQKKKVFPCEGRPPVKEEDKEVKDKKLEETKKQWMTTIKPEEELMVLVATKTCIKGGNNALEATSTEDKANVMEQRIAEKFSMDAILYSKNSIQEKGKASLLQITSYPPVDDEDVGAKSKEEKAKWEEEKAKLEEKNAKLEEENAILKEQVAKCKEGSEQLCESIKGNEVLLRQILSDFHAAPIGNALNKALMTSGRNTKELDNMPQKQFSVAIAALVNEKRDVEDAKNKLIRLKESAESFKPTGKGILKDLVWDQKCGECYFVACKTVAILNAQKFHPNIKGDDATRQIEKMASDREFIFEGVDVGNFMVTQLNHNKVRSVHLPLGIQH